MFGEKKSPRSGGAVETRVGPHAVIRGDVVFAGGLYVEGAIYGKVVAEEAAKSVLTIADNGLVEGEVFAPVVCINGRMVGDASCSRLHSGRRAGRRRVAGH